jgi:hypothetical protein
MSTIIPFTNRRIFLNKVLFVLMVVMFFCTTVTAGELAKQGNYDLMSCYSGKAEVIAYSKTHIALSYVFTGTCRSNPPGGIFDMTSFQGVGLSSIINGKSTSNYFMEYVDSDGDKIFLKGDRRNGPNGTAEFLAGTGKYEGISGSATNELVGNFPSARPGTFQGCSHATGTYTLP